MRCHRVITLFVVTPCYSLHTFFSPTARKDFSVCVWTSRRLFSYLSEQGERATGDGDGAHGGREDGRVRGRGGGRREDGGRGRSGQGRRVRGGRGEHGRGRRGGGGRGRGEGRRVRRRAEILPVLLSMRGPVQQRHRPIASAVQVLRSHGE